MAEALRADVRGLLKEVEGILASSYRVVSPMSNQVLGVGSGQMFLWDFP